MTAATRTCLLVVLVCNLIWQASCGLCGDDVKSKATSTDGQLVAYVYERNCGATTDFSAMVNVQSSREQFHGDEGILFVAKGRYDLSVEWTSPRALLITCSRCSRKDVFRQVVAFGDVDVKFVFAADAR